MQWHLEHPLLCLVSIIIIFACLLWLLFPAFSSVAISAANHADSRGSLASLDSIPSTNEKNSEGTEACEKVHMHANGQKIILRLSNLSDSFKDALCSTQQIVRPLSLIGSALRFDKLDQAETRSLLMCFLHIMKTISEGKINRRGREGNPLS